MAHIDKSVYQAKRVSADWKSMHSDIKLFDFLASILLCSFHIKSVEINKTAAHMSSDLGIFPLP